MARLKLLLTFVVVLWFGGRSPALAQMNNSSSEEGSGNTDIGNVDILSCCMLFHGTQDCYKECIDIHNTAPNNLLSPVLRDCSPGAFTYYETCINASSTAPTASTTSTAPAITPAVYRCCELANTLNCTRECQRLVLANGSEAERFNELLGYCAATDPSINCFLRNATLPPSSSEAPPPADLIRRRCCHTAVSDYCRDNCLRFYEDVTNEAWQVVETDCVHRPTEGKLASCLADVSSACKLGCKDMEFCTTFNNRANQLFRQCLPDSDAKAKQQLHEWQSNRLFDHHPVPPMRLKNISQCLPDMWKLLACFYHTEPCHPVALTTYMCREDCMKMFTECGENLGPAQVEVYCEELSPPNNDSCISLSTFIDEHEAEPIHQPCNSNPCRSREVCQVNTACLPEDPTCMQYRCVRGCFLGNSIHTTNSVPVPNNTIVQVQLPEDDNCTSYVHCNSDNLYDSYAGQSDRTGNLCYHEKVCSVQGVNGEITIHQHGESFQLDCNHCYCNYGQVTCSSKNCATPLCPNCAGAEYKPVCTPANQTLPSRCVAECQGWHDDQLTDGNCGEFSSCTVHECPVGTWCVENRQVCLGKSTNCTQYSCERYLSCQANEGTQIQPVCDIRSQQWATLCNLLQARRDLAYRGFCKSECASSGPVCGMDGNVYTSTCHANSYYVAVDYIGACNGSISGSHCANVICPELPSKGCTAVIPAGACCPVCGGVVEILLDVHHLNRTVENLNIPHVSVQDILKELNARLSTVECVLYGHVTVDGTFVVISIPTKSPDSAMMVEVCSAEVALVASCINNKSPLYLSSPLLSHFLQAELFTSRIIPSTIVSSQPPSPSSAPSLHHLTRQCSIFLLTFLLLLLFNAR